MALVRGACGGDLATGARRAIVAAAEERLTEMALQISRLTDSGSAASTVSVSRIVLRPAGASGCGDATVDVGPRALVGGTVAPEPGAPVVGGGRRGAPR